MEATTNKRFLILASSGTTTNGSTSSTSPKTGDGANMSLWIALCLVAGVSIAGVITDHSRRARLKRLKKHSTKKGFSAEALCTFTVSEENRIVVFPEYEAGCRSAAIDRT